MPAPSLLELCQSPTETLAFVPERVVGQVVFRQVSVDLAVGPVDDRIHLEHLVLQLRRRRAAPGLRLWSRRRPESQAEAPSSLTARFMGSTLFIAVVAVEPLEALLPELSVDGLLVGGGT